MFTSSLSEEVKVLEEDIEVVKDKVDDPVICEKIRQFVYAPREIQDMFKADAGSYIPWVFHNRNLRKWLCFHSGRESQHSHRSIAFW
jgi:hypothetical protein